VMVNTSLMFSSERHNWKTPKAIYAGLDAEFNFDFDPCPPEATFDGLMEEWGESNFVNPPYGPDMEVWLAKGVQEWRKGRTCVFLVAARTDTRWWHEYCLQATEIRFIKGRLRFDDQENTAPFPSVIVIFIPTEAQPPGPSNTLVKACLGCHHWLRQHPGRGPCTGDRGGCACLGFVDPEPGRPDIIYTRDMIERLPQSRWEAIKDKLYLLRDGRYGVIDAQTDTWWIASREGG
jgi:hypothetical protein